MRDQAYKFLDASPEAACAAGAELVRTSKDDWERLMIATSVNMLGGQKGRSILTWAMASSTSLEEAFDGCFQVSCDLASQRKPEYLPAIFLMLRTHDQAVYLPLHDWYIRTHESLFFVFGRYGGDVIPYLRPMLRHSDPYVRRNTAIILGYFMKESKPTFIKMLAASDIGSGGAAFALGQLDAKDAIQPIAELLKSSSARTRFWAAYSLYEIGSKDAIPALTAAKAIEKDKDTLQEIDAAIENCAGAKTTSEGVPKLNKEQLQAALLKVNNENGYKGDFAAIAASAGRDELDRLEEIRQKTLEFRSKKGVQLFENWTEVITAVRRRVD